MALPAEHTDAAYVAGGIGRFLERLVAEAKTEAKAAPDKAKP